MRVVMHGVAVVGALVLGALAGSAQPALADGRAFVTAGELRADLVWRGQRARPDAVVLRVAGRAPTLRVAGLQRGGVGIPPGQPLQLRDLDRSGHIEVIADLSSGAAGCCLTSQIVRRDEDRGRFVRTVHDWGAAGYVLRDLDRDRRPEFISADDRLTFGVPAAARRMPLRIWSYRAGHMKDVTRDFPALVLADMVGHWRAFAALERAGAPTRAAIAAYLAGAHLIDRPAAGRARLLARFRGAADRRFIIGVERRLAAFGYSSAHPAPPSGEAR